MKAKTLVLILSAALLFGCNKEEDGSITRVTHYVDSTLLTEYFFERGSYWVYINQLMHVDSVAVLNTTQGLNVWPCPHGCPGGEIDQYEYMTMDLKGFSQLVYNYYFSGCIKLNGGGEYGQLGQPIFCSGSIPGDEFNGFSVVAKYDSMQVLNNTFYDVTHNRVTADEQYQEEFETDTDLYFSPNVGLIKKVVYDSTGGIETWNLTRYLVVQN